MSDCMPCHKTENSIHMGLKERCPEQECQEMTPYKETPCPHVVFDQDEAWADGYCAMCLKERCDSLQSKLEASDAKGKALTAENEELVEAYKKSLSENAHQEKEAIFLNIQIRDLKAENEKLKQRKTIYSPIDTALTIEEYRRTCESYKLRIMELEEALESAADRLNSVALHHWLEEAETTAIEISRILSKPSEGERCKHDVWKADHCYSCSQNTRRREMNAKEAREILSYGECQTDSVCCRAKGYLQCLEGEEVKGLVEALEFIQEADLLPLGFAMEGGKEIRDFVEEALAKFKQAVEGK